MPRTRPPYPQKFREKIVELARNGRTPKELAEEFEPTQTTIRNWLKQADRDEGASSDGPTTEDGLVVFEGSKASMETVSSAPDAVLRRRKSLQEEGTLVEEDGALVFTEDHSFDSPSGAAGAVLGRSSNGWQEWENGPHAR